MIRLLCFGGLSPMTDEPTTTVPWQHPDLADWSIVGMNHYHITGTRFLFVAMMRGDRCIKAEGADSDGLWEQLRRRAREDVIYGR